jgi:hypothetical protein
MRNKFLIGFCGVLLMSGFTQYATPANAAEKVSNTNSKKLSSEHRLRSSGTEIFSCLTNLVALSADVPQSSVADYRMSKRLQRTGDLVRN